MTGAPLFHLALAPEWADAVAAGEYRRSTLGVSLADEGFVHASFAHQLQPVADHFFRDRDDVVVLRIDPAALDAPVVVEDLYDAGEAFPHVYGPIPVAAVTEVVPVSPGADGRLVLDGLA